MAHRLPKEALQEAQAAVVFAQQIRAHYRRRPDRSPTQREKDIEQALKRLRKAMVPIRSEIGRFPHEPTDVDGLQKREKIREASASIQRERRKLFKMRRPDRA